MPCNKPTLKESVRGETACFVNDFVKYAEATHAQEIPITFLNVVSIGLALLSHVTSCKKMTKEDEKVAINMPVQDLFSTLCEHAKITPPAIKAPHSIKPDLLMLNTFLLFLCNTIIF